MSNAQNANSGELSAVDEQLKKEMEIAKAEHELAEKRYQDLLSRLETVLMALRSRRWSSRRQSCLVIMTMRLFSIILIAGDR